MHVKDLQARQGKVDIELDVLEVGEARTFEKFGKSGKVANAKAQDGTGQITLSLWNEQVDQVKPGNKIKISNGWVSEWQGELQLSTGKFGKLEIIGKGDTTEGSSAADATETAESTEEPPVEEEKIE